jgi:Ca2+-binding EF-hand superfamily protein
MRSGREVENAEEVIHMLNEVAKNNNSQLSIEEFMKIIEND